MRRLKRWRAFEIEQIARRYALEGPEQLARDLGRSPDAVSGIATRLGLRSETRRVRQSLTRRWGRKILKLNPVHPVLPAVKFQVVEVGTVPTNVSYDLHSGD